MPHSAKSLPCQPFGIGHDEADTLGMADVPNTELLLQRALGQHHHLRRAVSGHWSPMAPLGWGPDSPGKP